ncbi:hypothetical protein Tco_0751512 [Tanacetum coccineum]|uniref:Uncharacterized protein n=1 Tax=Tanacetum coccineum TaxID=301880 RepID=A0ABQ4Z5U6_9ASTR
MDDEEEINTSREEINIGIKEVSNGSTKVDSGTTSKRGQREGKAPMVEEDIQATHKTKEQITQEEAGLEEAIKLQAQMDEELAKQIHLDEMVAKRMTKEEALSKQQKKRKAQVQFEAQYYTEEDRISTTSFIPIIRRIFKKRNKKPTNPSTEWKEQSQKSSQVKKIQLEGLKNLQTFK